jgi:hypothetical protein
VISSKKYKVKDQRRKALSKRKEFPYSLLNALDGFVMLRK